MKIYPITNKMDTSGELTKRFLRRSLVRPFLLSLVAILSICDLSAQIRFEANKTIIQDSELSFEQSTKFSVIRGNFSTRDINTIHFFDANAAGGDVSLGADQINLHANNITFGHWTDHGAIYRKSTKEFEVYGDIKATNFIGNGSQLTGIDASQIANLPTGGGNSSLWTQNTTDINYVGGNVGIGTQNPNRLLHLHATSVSRVKFTSSGTGETINDGFEIGTSGTNEALISNKENSDMILLTNNLTRLTIKSNGSVGIGTGSPSEMLDISGNVKATLFLGDGSQLTGIDASQISNLPGSLWTQNGTDLSYISGNVEVGMPSQKRQLLVNGDVVAHRMAVSPDPINFTDWPDYVFEADYQLTPLVELEEYIEANKHLPEVPSATEVAEDGIDLGNMDKTLLKKLEELTLYIIEQNKRIEQLEAKLAEQPLTSQGN